MTVAPDQMFLHQTDLYSKFDSTGLPTHNAAGEELSKSLIKKLKKEQEKQQRLHDSSKQYE